MSDNYYADPYPPHEDNSCDYCGHDRVWHTANGPCEECDAMPFDTYAHKKAWHSFEEKEETS